MCFCLLPPTQNNEEISLIRNSLRKINFKIARYAHPVTCISEKLLFFIYFASENCKSHTQKTDRLLLWTKWCHLIQKSGLCIAWL